MKIVCNLFLLFSLIQVYGEWNQFRGETGQGHVDSKIPKFWSQNSSNLAWRTSIIGTAWSSPILVRDQVVVTNARTLNDGKSLDLEVIFLVNFSLSFVSSSVFKEASKGANCNICIIS